MCKFAMSAVNKSDCEMDFLGRIWTDIGLGIDAEVATIGSGPQDAKIDVSYSSIPLRCYQFLNKNDSFVSLYLWTSMYNARPLGKSWKRPYCHTTCPTTPAPRQY